MKNKRLRSRFFLTASIFLAFYVQQYAQFVDFSLWQDAGIEMNLGAPGGITVEDYDGDGLTDLLILNGSLSNNYANILYRNTGNGFEQAGGAVLPTHSGKYNAGAFADFNGDGEKDFYLGAWNYNISLNTENQLFAGNSMGMFTNTAAGPPVTDQNSTNGCSWADVNGDGWLDIFVSNCSTSFSSAPNALYFNQGDGAFYKDEENIVVTGAAVSGPPRYCILMPTKSRPFTPLHSFTFTQPTLPITPTLRRHLTQFFLPILRRGQARLRLESFVEGSLIVKTRLIGNGDHVAFLIPGIGQ